MYSDQKKDFVRRVESAAYKSIYKAFRMDAIPGLQAAEQINLDLQEFALHFTPNLLELDITEPYTAEIILNTNNISDTGNNTGTSTGTSSNNTGNNSKTSNNTTSNNTGNNLSSTGRVLMKYGNKEILGEKIHVSTIPVDDDSLFSLKITISYPYKAFWGRMWGLLLSSVLIVVLLSGVLLYLIKTMFRQKNLEQMRQDFTHNITHELKTPIATAIAATDALRNFSAGANPERRIRYLQIIVSQLEQLSGMVEKILEVSVEGENEKINKELIHLFPTIESLVQEIRMSSSAPEVEIDCPSGIEVLADPFHLKNVLATLLDNAIKYSAPKESSTAENSLSTDTSGRQCKIKVSAQEEADYTIIEVADNGCGIAREHLPHIFEKYYRVPQGDVHQVRGYGLGLHYAQKVIELQGGTISAQSRLGAGTTIKIRLPKMA